MQISNTILMHFLKINYNFQKMQYAIKNQLTIYRTHIYEKKIKNGWVKKKERLLKKRKLEKKRTHN